MLIFKKEGFRKGKASIFDRKPKAEKKKRRGKDWKEGDELEEYECHEGILKYLSPEDQDKPISFEDEAYVLGRYPDWFKKA